MPDESFSEIFSRNFILTNGVIFESDFTSIDGFFLRFVLTRGSRVICE